MGNNVSSQSSQLIDAAARGDVQSLPALVANTDIDSQDEVSTKLFRDATAVSPTVESSNPEFFLRSVGPELHRRAGARSMQQLSTVNWKLWSGSCGIKLLSTCLTRFVPKAEGG